MSVIPKNLKYFGYECKTGKHRACGTKKCECQCHASHQEECPRSVDSIKDSPAKREPSAFQGIPKLEEIDSWGVCVCGHRSKAHSTIIINSTTCGVFFENKFIGSQKCPCKVYEEKSRDGIISTKNVVARDKALVEMIDNIFSNDADGEKWNNYAIENIAKIRKVLNHE